jgi:hypothetical protein
MVIVRALPNLPERPIVLHVDDTRSLRSKVLFAPSSDAWTAAHARGCAGGRSSRKDGLDEWWCLPVETCDVVLSGLARSHELSACEPELRRAMSKQRCLSARTAYDISATTSWRAISDARCASVRTPPNSWTLLSAAARASEAASSSPSAAFASASAANAGQRDGRCPSRSASRTARVSTSAASSARPVARSARPSGTRTRHSYLRGRSHLRLVEPPEK